MERLSIANEVMLGEVCALLAEGKRVRIRAKGGSMRPLIRGDEDTLVLAPVTALRKGDVVLARIGGCGYVVHRIVGIDGDRVTLMGDGNLYRTEDCSRTDIYGKAVAVIRNGKERSLTSFRAMLHARIWRRICIIKHHIFINNHTQSKRGLTQN